jgi:hypothetical protein
MYHSALKSISNQKFVALRGEPEPRRRTAASAERDAAYSTPVAARLL